MKYVAGGFMLLVLVFLAYADGPWWRAFSGEGDGAQAELIVIGLDCFDV